MSDEKSNNSCKMEFPNFCVRMTDKGLGLFALKRFKQGEPLGEVTGEYIPDVNYSSDYGMFFKEGCVEPDAPFRYMNHSCEPNCELVEWEIRDEQNQVKDYILSVYATRVIRPGEEICIDYAWPAENAIPCKCGSKKCRGWVVSEEERNKLPVQKEE